MNDSKPVNPAIIAVAITGSVPRKKDTPAIPVTPDEQIESTHEAYEAGAALVHIHVRDDDENPSSDAKRFALVAEGIRRHCPDIIIQFSTGGRGRSHAERGAALAWGPDMASLATGSVNFPNMIYENPPALIDTLAAEMLERRIKPEIEIFDLSMLYKAAQMVDGGALAKPPHVQFVMGIQNALPVGLPRPLKHAPFSVCHRSVKSIANDPPVRSPDRRRASRACAKRGAEIAVVGHGRRQAACPG